MEQPPKRFAKSVPGPFYATGECISCGAPEAEAPELLSELSDENWDTYFVRQPQSSDEIERACSAIEVCCVSSLRYSGRDASIIRRLGNRPEYCDHTLPGGPVRLHWESDERWRMVQSEWRGANRPWWRFW